MSAHATTPDAVRWLSGAICSITNGTDASIKSTFATAAVVDAVVRMSTHAAIPDAVRWLLAATSSSDTCFQPFAMAISSVASSDDVAAGSSAGGVAAGPQWTAGLPSKRNMCLATQRYHHNNHRIWQHRQDSMHSAACRLGIVYVGVKQDEKLCVAARLHFVPKNQECDSIAATKTIIMAASLSDNSRINFSTTRLTLQEI